MSGWEWWPLYVFFGGAAAYELFSFVTRVPGYPYKRLPTISQLIWWAWDRFAMLPYLVGPFMAWLYVHLFVFRKRNPPDD